jgi:hypothetical protein
MALQMGTGSKSSEHSSYESAMFDDLSRIQVALVGHCFDHLRTWQRVFARWMLVLAARAVSSAQCTHVDGWMGPPPFPKIRIEKTEHATETGESLHVMIERSYERDIASQKARVALRRDVPEASDRYFADDADDGATELLPALVRFREKAAFKLRRV